MKNDERITADVLKAKSMGYTIFWFGIFGILLYRWFYLNEPFKDTAAFFIIWLLASIVQFFLLAIKGIPITYPISSTQKEQIFYIVLVPLFTGVLTAFILFFFKEDVPPIRIFGGFIFSFLATLIIFLAYKLILHLWELRNLE